MKGGKNDHTCVRAYSVMKRRILEFYHQIRDQFFRHELRCHEFLQLLSSSRFLFSRQSTVVFPHKSADSDKVPEMVVGDKRKTIQFGFVWFLSSYVNF